MTEENRAQTENSGGDFEQLLAKGKELGELNDLHRARVLLQQAAELRPEHLEPRLWLARLAYRAYDWKDLLAHCKAYLAIRPYDREILLLNARACSGLANWGAAADAWARVSEDRPEWSEAKYQQARSLIRSGHEREASELAHQLSASDDPDGRAYAMRLFVDLDEFSSALTIARALFEKHRDVATRETEGFERQSDYRGLGVALRARIDTLGTNSEIEETKLTAAENLFRRAIGSERAGDLLSAYFDYEALLTLAPDDGLAQRSCARLVRDLRLRAQEQLANGNLADAAAAYRQACRTAPSDINLKRNFGRVLTRMRDWPRAAEIWRDFSTIAPDDPEGWVQLARALDRSHRFVEAIAAWRQVQQISPDHEEAETNLSTVVKRMIFAGRTAIAEERFLDAYRLFKAVLNEEPDNEEGTRRLEQVGRNLLKAMRSAYKAQDYRQVVEYADAAAELLPDDSELRLLVGRSASAMRRYHPALKAWTRLEELDPGQAVLANLQIARCHLYLGNLKEGQAAIKRVRAIDPKNADAKVLSERLKSAA